MNKSISNRLAALEKRLTTTRCDCPTAQTDYNFDCLTQAEMYRLCCLMRDYIKRFPPCEVCGHTPARIETERMTPDERSEYDAIMTKWGGAAHE